MIRYYLSSNKLQYQNNNFSPTKQILRSRRVAVMGIPSQVQSSFWFGRDAEMVFSADTDRMVRSSSVQFRARCRTCLRVRRRLLPFSVRQP